MAGGLDGKTVGVIGLGLMGKPMARNLKTAGATVVVHNRSRGPVEELAAEGMIAADSPADVAGKADIVIVMVSDTPAVTAVAEGPGGLLPAFRPGTLIIDMGTTEVPETRRLAALAEARGGRWLDAPVSGGQVGAVQGTLTIMAGGAEADFRRAEPVFAALGQRMTLVGPVGAGQIAKAANQLIVGLTIGAVSEALALAKAAGADPARVRQALEGGFAWSRIMELHGQRMISGDFTPGGKVRTQLKDLTQAEALAASVGLELPALSLNRHLYAQSVERGDGDLDHAALYRLYGARKN